jgi:hypothetical protein
MHGYDRRQGLLCHHRPPTWDPLFHHLRLGPRVHRPVLAQAIPAGRREAAHVFGFSPIVGWVVQGSKEGDYNASAPFVR